MRTLYQTEKAENAVQEVRRLVDGRSPVAASRIVGSLGVENYLGGGDERQVFSLGEDRAVAFYRELKVLPEDVPRQMKAYYYAAKLARLVLPEHFPDVHLAGSQPPLMIMERIHPSEDPVTSHDIYTFRRQLDRMGMAEAIDYNTNNFLMSRSGQIIYADVVTPEKFLTSEFKQQLSVVDDEIFSQARDLQAKILRNVVD